MRYSQSPSARMRCFQADGRACEVREVEFSDEVAEKCIALSRSLKLPLARIDLKVPPDDELCCFKVNPLQAFSYDEGSTGHPISEVIVMA